ncbi:MAG: SGNH/GDSL hydrolase family protein [Candidatus Chisholmbacteria bacterium]|nr:SGNH/GDSL hydrolase family protein [Candidatus Chisholmbacteria bacterium]
MNSLFARSLYFVRDFKWYGIVLVATLAVAVATILLLGKQKKFSKKTTNSLLALMASITTLVIVFIIGEAYFRYVYDQSDGIGFLLVNQKWHDRHIIFNSDFRRDQEFVIDKKPNEYRLAVIGDSITFGMGIKNPEDRFSNILETQLNQKYPSVTVYNLGLSGTDTNEQIDDFLGLDFFDFDLVVWQYYFNDINTATTSAQISKLVGEKKRLTYSPLLRKFFDSSFLADFLYWRFTTTYDHTFRSFIESDLKLYHDPSILDGHKRSIEKFINTLHQRQVPIVVILFPLLYSDDIREFSADEYATMLELFTAFGADATINFAEALAPYKTEKLKASIFDQHPNEFVHQKAADLLYPEISQIIENQKK